MFGLIANKPVNIMYSFYRSPTSMEGFSLRNPDGWGVAWLSGDGEWMLFKEPIALYESLWAEEKVKEVKGRIIISHVRMASWGGITMENTHPWLYRGWVFAHNGTIDERDRIEGLLEPSYRRGLEGDTDSERFFHLIVQEAKKVGNPIRGIIRAVELVIKNSPFSSLNFLASDGSKLYALRYAWRSLNYYTLYTTKRTAPTGLEKLSKQTRQMLEMKLAASEKAFIVASEPMSDEPDWIPLQNKTLLVVDNNLNVETVRL